MHDNRTEDEEEVGQHRSNKGGGDDNVQSLLEGSYGEDDLHNVPEGSIEQTSDDISKAKSQI